jgi:tellurite resistance protein TehA-like permease
VAAGTCVLGGQLLLLGGKATAGAGLEVVAAVVWAVLTLSFFAAVVIRRHKPSLRRGLNGSWLLVVVSTQALSVLATLLARELAAAEALLFLALALYLLGCLLYIVLIALVLYRLVFVPLLPTEFTPDYWITMGAAAITTLAGATLLSSTGRWVDLDQLSPLLLGLSLLFWAGGSWWIPLLVVLDVWRRSSVGWRLSYGSAAWARVFPLGMYATATHELGRAGGLSLLLPLSTGVLYVALAAWLLTFAGLLRATAISRSR